MELIFIQVCAVFLILYVAIYLYEGGKFEHITVTSLLIILIMAGIAAHSNSYRKQNTLTADQIKDVPKAKVLLDKCEAELPRNQSCVVIIYAVPK